MRAENVHGVGLADTYADPSLRRGGGRPERLASLVVGFLVAALGWRRGGLVGALGLVGGGALIWRGVSGRRPAPRALGPGDGTQPGRSREMEPGASASVALGRGVGVDERVVIERSVAEVYAFVRDLPNLAGVMGHVEKIEVSSSALSHWTVPGPAGVRFEWDAEVFVEHPGERIAWRSREGSDVRSAGSVHFVPLRGGPHRGARPAEVRAPAGAVGDAIARLHGDSLGDALREDLGRLKEALEQPAP